MNSHSSYVSDEQTAENGPDSMDAKFDEANKMSGCPDLTITRPLLTVSEKRDKYKYSQPIEEDTRSKFLRSVKDEFTCSADRFKKALFLRIPILFWVSHYDVKKGLLGDVIAGITVAVMNIPQGMAYASLANVDPIIGIYMAFIPVLIYGVFASSRHISTGTFAVICLMTGKVVTELATFPPDGSTAGLSTTISPDSLVTSVPLYNGTTDIEYSPIEVATILAFEVGLWMLLFGFLNLGSFCVFLSDMLVSGFTTGAAVHVFTSQIKSLFGVVIPSFTGPFKIIFTWGAVLKNILDSNPATMVISMLCIIIILINNEIFKPRLRKITMIPIPIELIVVIGGTLASRYGHLNENFDIAIVGAIPTGLPAPVAPPFALFSKVIVSSLTLTIVSFTISYSMAKIFALKHDYNVDATQELYANSVANLVGSFFLCAPISASLSRSLIQVNVGGYSQLASFISATIIMFVLLFIGPFFETLPNCVLAAIIITALKGMFLQFGDFTRRLKVSRVDASLWMVTFLGVVVIDIDYGLLIGIVYSIILLVSRNQTPSVEILGRVPDTDIYLEQVRYASVEEVSGMKLCQISGTLHYANRDSLRASIIEVSGIDPKAILKMKKKKEKALDKYQKEKLSEPEATIRHRNISIEKLDDESASYKGEEIVKANGIRPSLSSMDPRMKEIEKRFMALEMPDSQILVLDMSGVNSMDISSCKNLSILYSDYTAAGIAIYFAGTSENCLETMELCGVSKEIPAELFFHSVHDVVTFLSSTKCNTKN